MNLTSMIYKITIQKIFILIILLTVFTSPSSMALTYGITVSDEDKYLDRLLKQLVLYLDKEDKIVIQIDQNKTNKKVSNVINSYNKKLGTNQIKIINYKFNGDFSKLKNNLLNQLDPTGYILLLDADEYPTNDLLVNIKWIISEYEGVDVISLPRLNYYLEPLSGRDLDHYNKGIIPNLDTNMRLNYPDYQTRIINLTNPELRFNGKLHEGLANVKTNQKIILYGEGLNLSLIHFKSIGKQLISDKLYQSIEKHKGNE